MMRNAVKLSQMDTLQEPSKQRPALLHICKYILQCSNIWESMINNCGNWRPRFQKQKNGGPPDRLDKSPRYQTSRCGATDVAHVACQSLSPIRLQWFD
ncbi:hypothetical protein MTP99_012653 [Tenebrio molitor]|nr:hypothetical protein MTP99_012653 [Tenebrio molitor]